MGNQLGLDFAQGIRLLAGVDEVGRGPLAGPVIAAAVILDPGRSIEGLADSKALSPRRREALAEQIRAQAVCWGIGRADVAEIDRLNIFQASLLAMQRAVSRLEPLPEFALIDGTHCPELPCPAEAVIKGDATIGCISAASILAKVARDAELVALDLRYPGYGFAEHKGYPTPAHLEALERLGACAVHRRSYAPVRRALGLDEELA